MGGVAVPFLASISATYGQTINNVYFAALTVCVVAFVSIFTLMLIVGSGVPTKASFQNVEPWHLIGGMFFAIYVVSMTFVAPKIGLGNAIVLVVVAQMFTAVTFDHFGLMGAVMQHITPKRICGLMLLCAGVVLSRT